MQIRCVALDFALQVLERVFKKHVTTPENAFNILPLPLLSFVPLQYVALLTSCFLSFTNPDFFSGTRIWCWLTVALTYFGWFPQKHQLSTQPYLSGLYGYSDVSCYTLKNFNSNCSSICFCSLITGWNVGKVHSQILTMAAVHHQGYPLRDSLYWDETECLNYYGMLSLHEVFEVVGSQLTETDIEVLSFLLNETCSATHPLDPAGWTVEPREDNPDDPGVAPSPQLLKAWQQLKPTGSQQPFLDPKPKSGLELLLQLERKGYLSDGNLAPLLQLLRVLTRHDLLPLVSHKKRRTGEDLEIMSCCSWSQIVCHYVFFMLFSFSRENWTEVWDRKHRVGVYFWNK